MDDHIGPDLGGDGERLRQNFNARPPDRLKGACDVDPPGWRMDGVEERVTLKRLHALQVMQTFIHNFYIIGYGGKLLERSGERFVIEAVGGDAKHSTGYSRPVH